ncbi:flagellar hook-length control protein FliK [Thermosyntropha sp.]|uniref:flagellar hook-length control protein FliK n=1 Tax=Thermosyntropha sp. TaxID=2740820 RepID=UPI0025FFD94E|nr:flagellar hook-length control protein FliK [Thermosyntropha sp.]MBO8158639.1 flagellar hook-length control protein FliK [Thermosyntropha sp.]
MSRCVSLNNIQLNITFPEGQSLNLKKGEIIKGQVKDVKDNGLVIILLKGKIIEALSEAVVKPGDQLYLMVENFKDNRAYLKVLTPEVLTKLEDVSLSLHLSRAGITAGKEEIEAARKLMQYNLPVTQENIKELLRGVKILGEFNRKNLEIAAFTLAKGLPINKDILETLAHWTGKGTDLSQLFDNILKIISLLEGEGNIGSPNNFVFSTLSEGEKIVKTGNLSFSELEAKPVSKNEINRFFQPLKPWLQVLKKVLEEIRIDLKDEKGLDSLPLKLRQVLPGEKELLKVLSLSLEILQNEESANKTFIGQELIKNLNDGEKELIGQRLFNFISRNMPDNNFNCYYFALPVQMEDGMYLLEMKIRRDSRQKDMRNADNLSLVVGLNTSKLGKVLFHINWARNATLDIRGVVESEQVKDHIEKNIKELLSSLSALGYKVNNLGIKVAEDKDELVLKSVKLVPAVEDIKPFSIDIVV